MYRIVVQNLQEYFKIPLIKIQKLLLLELLVKTKKIHTKHIQLYYLQVNARIFRYIFFLSIKLLWRFKINLIKKLLSKKNSLFWLFD